MKTSIVKGFVSITAETDKENETLLALALRPAAPATATPKRKGGRKRKYATREEALAARRAYMRAYMRQRQLRLKEERERISNQQTVRAGFKRLEVTPA